MGVERQSLDWPLSTESILATTPGTGLFPKPDGGCRPAQWAQDSKSIVHSLGRAAEERSHPANWGTQYGWWSSNVRMLISVAFEQGKSFAARLVGGG